jgi:hypothetical protein
MRCTTKHEQEVIDDMYITDCSVMERIWEIRFFFFL